jgi:hypothetical protein
VNGTAVSGSDYTATSGTLSVAPGTTQQTINVAVTGDALHEPDEQFLVRLSNATNAAIAAADGAGTIVNDDPTPAISIADVSVTEGNAGTVNASFALTLSGPSGQAVSVGFATANGTATAGADYVAASGTATFAAGSTTTSVNVAVTADAVFEPNETFVLNLSTPVNATLARAQATATIVNDEAAPSLSILDATVAEGNAGATNATVTVALSPASSQPVTVEYTTADGTATAGTDYTAGSGSLTFLPGVTAQTITVAVTGDGANEASETVLVNLANSLGAVILDGQATLTITNDDAVGLVAAYSFEEGAGTTTSDLSGRGHTGTIAGATWTTAGKNGRALSFDGVNDMVSVADTAALDVTRVTVMAWVNPTTLSGWRTAVMKERPSGLAFALYAHDDIPRPAGYVNLAGNDRAAEGGVPIALNAWTHLAMTFDGTNVRLYVNGALVKTAAFTGNITTSANPLRIGGNAIWGEYFAGLIDDVRIYNRALTQAELQADMNAAVR